MNPPVTWSWRGAVHGVLLALPATVLTARDAERGIALFVGVLCVAALGIRPARRQRLLSVVAGTIAAASIFLGSCVAGHHVLAVLALFAVGVVAAVASRRIRFGPLVLMLGPALFAAGLSEDGATVGLGAAGLILLGSVYGWLVSLPWPDEPAPTPMPARSTTELGAYGIRLGLTGALAVSVGYLLDFDHPGWPGVAALMVSRPGPDLTRSRAVGRALSVVVGAGLAIGLVATDPTDVVLASSAAAAIVLLCATAGSRWYITAGFTTFVVLSMLDLRDPSSGAWWFTERVVGTLIGVAIAVALATMSPGAGGLRHQNLLGDR